MRLVILSDTHERHHQIEVPSGDVLIHTGDFCSLGTQQEAVNFMLWFENQPHAHKIFIAGNHDRIFESQNQHMRELVYKLMPSCTYLQDSATMVEGLKIYGSPWTPFFLSHRWVFHRQRGDQMAEKWELVPSDVDILLTHGPAFGILDLTREGMRAGCEQLDAHISTRLTKLKLHAFGHIHEGYGAVERNGYISMNASICDRAYSPINAPMVIDL